MLTEKQLSEKRGVKILRRRAVRAGRLQHKKDIHAYNFRRESLIDKQKREELLALEREKSVQVLMTAKAYGQKRSLFDRVTKFFQPRTMAGGAE